MADILLSCSQRFPVDHGQCIVKEMGIDLCPQSLHLQALLPDLTLINLPDQLIDLRQHILKASYQNTHLIL